MSGLATDTFSFRGFLPAKKAARCNVLAELLDTRTTCVFFESKHRIVEALGDVVNVLGAGRRICLARELTKAFETVLSGEAGVLLEQTEANEDWQKGEFVLVIAGVKKEQAGLSAEVRSLLTDIAAEVPPKRAISIVAKHSGADKKELYEFLVAQKSAR